MGELDCSDQFTAIDSVCRISGIHPDTLMERLELQIPTADIGEMPFDEVIMVWAFGTQEVPLPDSVCWFHASRVPTNTTFADGLLPTSTMHKRIEAELCALAVRMGLCKEDDWPSLPRVGHDSYRVLSNTVGRSFDDGPHGFLVLETHLKRDGLPLPDYTASPELAKEICLSLPSRIGTSLLQEYNNARKPVIVKFRSRLQLPGTMKTAVNYIHAKLTESPLTTRCTRGFDGRGTAIPKADILDVQFI